MVRAAVAGLAGDTPAVLESIERQAQEASAAIGRAVIAGVVNLAGEDPPATWPCSGGHAARLVQRRTKTVRTLLGGFELTRGYYHCRRCRVGFAPLDERLGVAGTGRSPGLARAAALAGMEMPFAASGQFIATTTGLALASASTIGRTARAEGRKARSAIDAEHAKARPGPTAGAFTGLPGLCYIVLDGTGAPMLPRETQGRDGKRPDGKATTREVKLGCFFTQSGLDPVTAEPVQDPGSVSYISTFEPAGVFAGHVKAEYHRRGFDQIRQPVVIGDGAHWIWNIADTHIAHATQIVDYYHAREHLSDLTKLLAPVIDQPDTWQSGLVDRLDLGDTDAIADAVTALDLPTRAPDLITRAATEVGYFTGNHHRMQYASFQANGYYIGLSASTRSDDERITLRDRDRVGEGDDPGGHRHGDGGAVA